MERAKGNEDAEKKPNDDQLATKPIDETVTNDGGGAAKSSVESAEKTAPTKTSEEIPTAINAAKSSVESKKKTTPPTTKTHEIISLERNKGKSSIQSPKTTTSTDTTTASEVVNSRTNGASSLQITTPKVSSTNDAEVVKNLNNIGVNSLSTNSYKKSKQTATADKVTMPEGKDSLTVKGTKSADDHNNNSGRKNVSIDGKKNSVPNPKDEFGDKNGVSGDSSDGVRPPVNSGNGKLPEQPDDKKDPPKNV
ncbi:uncharacterized protein LOC133031074 [Cannabis sativa]|uniref:uncharacterized protein LOC133031074 n=1 Tax=Cannabis sativa TaxID=3483 RepID=UPI0029CA896E|nr:uncharacterized protein LOC133031074 [Cannabis sativa]